MVAPLRVSESRIVLRPSDGSSERLLSKFQTRKMPEIFEPTFEPSQRRYLVSPDGSRLAYADSRDGTLHVLDTSGRDTVIKDVRTRDMRFSADGRYFATLSGPDRSTEVVVLDLHSGAQRTLGTVDSPNWLEWTKDGIVVTALDAQRVGRGLFYAPLQGSIRMVAAEKGSISRFAAAARGTRVVYFTPREMVSLDVVNGKEPARTLLKPVHLAGVTNAEMSPSGDELAVATLEGVYLVRGEEAPELIERAAGVHSLWYSSDGERLAYASPTGAAVRSADETWRFQASIGDLRTLRFRHGADGVLIVRGERVLVWQPEEGLTTQLATIGTGGGRLEGADLWSSGLVTWTSKSLPTARGKVRKAKLSELVQAPVQLAGH